MLRTCSCVMVLTAMVAGPTAQAADTTLTLACKGKEISSVGARKSSEVINIGIIVDLQKKTVVGLEPTVPFTIETPLADQKAPGIRRISLGVCAVPLTE
jgi:uncharacterized protein YabE (DUF348 family)